MAFVISADPVQLSLLVNIHYRLLVLGGKVSRLEHSQIT